MFAHDHDEAYNEFRGDSAPLWDGNEDSETDGTDDLMNAIKGEGTAGLGRNKKKKGSDASVSSGWILGAVVFVVVAITTITVLVLIAKGHLSAAGSNPHDGDNKLKSVNRNSAGIANNPKAHEPVFVELSSFPWSQSMDESRR